MRTVLREIDTVIFDLDQTLFDKNQSLLSFANYQYNQFGLIRFIPNKREFIDKFTELNNVVMPKEEVYAKLIDIFHIEKSLYAELLTDLNTNFHLHSVGFPGLHEMLVILKQQGYKLGLITNGRDFYQRNKISALGITDYFSVIVTSGEVHIKKPDHAIFNIALKDLDSSCERTVFIGDSLRADIIPAKELGMFAILKSKDESHTEPDAICDNLMDLPNVINRICGL
ncbi:HAD family hydrolase [Paenibacillus sp. 2TAB23]|uniref:HAD family hydrolase n=1 Tax=Paenibacillus sp. 2TAB23 TaxID=3233004 RepID=UPI003F9925FB